MKIAVLYSSYEDSTAQTKQFDEVECNPAIHVPPGEPYTFELVPIKKTTAANQIFELSRSKEPFDLCINLCDGNWDEDRAGVEVIEALEMFSMAYTGAAPTFYKMTKEHQKLVAHAYGVRTPAHVLAHTADDIERAIRELDFPMIVKHFNGFASIGMTPDSRATTADGLRKEATRFINEFGGALIEEFIEGREFTVLVAENPLDPRKPIAFDPVECIFSGGETFKHFELKWITADTLKWAPVADDRIAETLKDMCSKVFVGMRGNSYGRADFRMDLHGNVFFLEMNPNCGIFYPKNTYGCADYVLSYDRFGHFKFIKLIIACALKSHREKKKKYKVAFRKGTGYGLQAIADITPGELVLKFEERPHNIVTADYALKSFDEQQTRFFHQYAWPLSEEVFSTWSDDPADWCPLNHSCNPNLWLDGLDVIARHFIRRGDFLSIDFATFRAGNMESFECDCGAVDCRKFIKASDHLEPWVLARYGDHVSSFVRSQQAKMTSKLAANGVLALEENTFRNSDWILDRLELPLELTSCMAELRKGIFDCS